MSAGAPKGAGTGPPPAATAPDGAGRYNPIASPDRRLRVRHDVTVLATDDGAIVTGPQTSLELKSGSIGAVLGWLWPRLDGSRSLAQLVGELPPDTRAAVAGLLARLHAKGMLLAVTPEDPAQLAVLSALYPEQMAFLANRIDAPLAAFERFRRARFHVRGTGVLLRNVAVALADYGARVATFTVASEDPALADLLDVANRRDADRHFTIGEGDPDRDGDAMMIDAGSTPFQPVVAEACRGGHGRSAAGIYGRGPILDVAVRSIRQETPPCFHGIASADGREAVIAPAAAAMAAHHCVAALFADLAELDLPAPPAWVEIDQDRLTSSVRRADPDPDCPGHGRAVRRLPLPVALPAAADMAGFPRPDVPDADPATIVTYDAIQRAAAGMIGPAGPIVAIEEGVLAQLPFAQSAARIRLGGTVERVVCAALSAREARNQALLLAAERWAAAMPDLMRDGGTIAAGWSLPEAVYRAACRHRRASVAPGSVSQTFALDELAGAGGTVAHLAELTRMPGLAGGAGALAVAPAVEGGWMARILADPSASAFGITPAQAMAKLLLHRLVRHVSPETVPAELMADVTAADVDALLATEAAGLSLTALAWPGDRDDAGAVRLHLVYASERPA